MKNIYYVYIFVEAQSGIPFYVGKGRNGRWQEHFRVSQLCKKTRIACKLRSMNVRPSVWFVQTNLFEDYAYELEEACIKAIGRLEDGGTLMNHRTERGVGPHGYSRRLIRDIFVGDSGFRILILLFKIHDV